MVIAQIQVMALTHSLGSKLKSALKAQNEPKSTDDIVKKLRELKAKIEPDTDEVEEYKPPPQVWECLSCSVDVAPEKFFCSECEPASRRTKTTE